MNEDKLLNYACLAEFKKEFYKDKLTHEHLVGGMIELNKFSYSDGTDVEVRFWGWEFKKGNDSYLLPARTADNKEVKLRTMLPLMAKKTAKVGSKGRVFNLIEQPVSMRFRPKKHMSFKAFVDKLSSAQHTNPEHYKLLWFMGLTAMLDRVYFRVCSPPSFGKSSVVDTLGHLLGDATKLVKPTLAKLEHRLTYKWVVLDEANDIPAAEWRALDQILLDIAGNSPSVEKHSMPSDKGKQTYDVSNFSFSMFYNDVTDYPEKSEYFDTITNKALIDRFPAFRVHGGFTQDFNSVRTLNVQEFVKEHEDDYRALIETFTYYKENTHSNLHWWKPKQMQNLPERWKINVDKILKIVDLYCESQEEFDHWCDVISASIQDYYEMSKFPLAWDKAKKKLSAKDVEDLKQQLKVVPTFAEKCELVTNYEAALVIRDVKVWQ